MQNQTIRIACAVATLVIGACSLAYAADVEKRAAQVQPSWHSQLDRVLDRSRLMPPAMAVPAVLDAKGDLKYNEGMQH